MLVKIFFSSFYELVLRYCRKPIVYDDKLHKLVIDKIFLLVIFHLAIGIYAYGSPDFFPNEVGIYLSTKETPSLGERNIGLISEISIRVIILSSLLYFI